jgi:hypothetical protein
MAERQVDYEPLRGELAFRALGRSPDGPGRVMLQGKNLREGLLATLVKAELLAASAGIVPFVPLGNGERGVLAVGAARSKLKRTDPAVRTVYLACHGAARRANAFARPSSGEGTRIDTPEGFVTEVAREIVPAGIGVIAVPVLVVMTVLGVAAMITGAWYALKQKEKDVELESDKARAAASAGSLADIARTQIAAGMPVDPAIVEGLREMAKKESASSWAGPVALGVVGAAMLGTGAWIAVNAGGRHAA